MMRSANEVMVLAGKAARGAGAPPAQAVQFGTAAAAHLIAGRNTEDLVAALANLPDGPILSLPLAILRVAEKAQSGLAQAPFAPTPLAHSYVSTLPFTAVLDEQGMLYLDMTKPAARAPAQRIDLPDGTYAVWSAYAARLLVPDTAASRASGAGAGLSDND